LVVVVASAVAEAKTKSNVFLTSCGVRSGHGKWRWFSSLSWNEGGMYVKISLPPCLLMIVGASCATANFSRSSEYMSALNLLLVLVAALVF